jgi:predicted GIY-YIG superfamily endonuclease
MENITHKVYSDLPVGLGSSPGAYVIEHAKTGKIYVGSTGDLGNRKRGNICQLKKGKHHNGPLQTAFNTDTELSFLLIPTDTREEAYQYEQKLINHHSSTGLLFNIAPDVKSTGKGLVRSEKTRQLISDAGKGRIPFNKGQPLSESHRDAVIASREKTF